MSHYNQPVPEGKDPELWELAQKRAGFKNHLITYLIVNILLWLLWIFTIYKTDSNNLNDWKNLKFPWPMWTTLGWGIGLAFHFAGVYIFPKANSVEKEYEKLKNQQQTK